MRVYDQLQLPTKRRLLSKAICIALATVFSISAHSQIALDPNKGLDQYNFDHWTSQNSLSGNAIIYVIQARNGYVWMASFSGMIRFDGVDFHTYSSYNTPQILNNSFTHVYEDNDEVIWGSTSGNGVVTFTNNKITAYTKEHGLPSNFVEEVVQDGNNRIWIATSKGLVYEEDSLFVNHEVPEPLKTISLKSIDIDADNNLWIASVENGVYKMGNQGELTHYNKSNGLLSDKINFVKADYGKIWIGTNEGLTILDGDEIQNLTVDDGLQDNMVTAIHIDSNDQLWVGSYKGFSRHNGTKFDYVSNKHPIYGKDVTSIMEDTERNLWVSTYRVGLFKFWEGKFTNYSDYSVDRNGPVTIHTIIEQDSDNYIFVFEDGVKLLNISSNTLEPFDASIDSIKVKFKFGLLDSSGTYWFATKGGVVKYANGKTDRLMVKDGLIDNNVRVILEDSQNNIWIGTFFGISMINRETGKITNFNTKGGLSNGYIMSIFEDSGGNIWISTRNGLNLYKDGVFKSYFEKDGLVGDFVFKLFEDKDSVFWIAGNAGLTRYKNGSFSKITTKDGLASGTIFQVLEDDFGYLWFTTNQRGTSLYKVLKKELNDLCEGKISKVNSIEYTQSDGIKSASSTSSSISIKASNGKIWIATHSGVEVIDPSEIKINNLSPPVVIESFNLNDQMMSVDGILTIPSGKQRVTIKYTALSFMASENIQIKHRLEGFDEDWITADETRETSYTNLPYGNYVFHVNAANSDGVWNEEGTSISFEVKPAFYETIPFYVLIVIFVSGLGLVIYFLRVRSLKKAQVALELIVLERTQEILHKKEEIESQNEEIDSQRMHIEQQNQELKKINLNLEDIVEERTEELKNAYVELLDVNKDLDTFIYRSVHDVRGPIARLQGLSHLISLQTEDKNILDLVNKLNTTATEMNDVFYRLLNIVRIRTSNLKIVEIVIEDQINKVIERIINAKGVDVNTIIDIKSGLKLNTDKAIFESIMHQLIDNAIKYRKDDELAKIRIEGFTDKRGNVCIKVLDNGVGVDSIIAPNVFNMFYVGQDELNGAGLGLFTAKTAVKALKGTIRYEKVNSDDFKTLFEIVLTNL